MNQYSDSDHYLEVLRQAIIDVLQCDISELQLDTSIEGDLGADSLDAYQILAIVQEELGIELETDRVEEIVTIEDALNLICETAE
ncbi:MAG: acyl carrier protein [Lachnospiraceae bacterium]|nr:acyl carrier protein [Lachnospiraceae bacterium]